MNKRLFINIPPRLASEEDDEAEIRAMFGITDEEPSSEATDTTGQTEGNTEVTATSTEAPGESQDSTGTNAGSVTPAQQTTTTEVPGNSSQDTDLDPETKFNASNKAFAQMRIQNKAYSELIMDLAKATGQEPKDLQEAQDILRGGLTKVVSKHRNIPEDVLREMEQDKAALAAYKQEQARQKALAGFQHVKDLHGLTKNDINEFVDKLAEKRMNPFEQPDIDLVKEYRHMYFDKLLAAAKEQGVQEERARSIKASSNSTTPSTQQGLPDNTGNQGNPIKSVKDLDKLLDSLK